MQGFADKAIFASRRVNWYVERACVALAILLVLDVWLGVMVRYVLPFEWTFTEELARYLMIWMALLIGVLLVFERLPPSARKWLAVAFDLIAFGFFAIIFFYGLGMVERGFGRFTMIDGIPKAYPFMGVPLAAAMACLQLILVTVHDFFSSDGRTAADRVDI
jgi:TRAP-type C4-dicarboxylate transport system permease small subunit